MHTYKTPSTRQWIEPLLDKLVYVSPQEIVDYCHKVNCNIPRRLRIIAYQWAVREHLDDEYQGLLSQQKNQPKSITLKEAKRIVRLSLREHLSESLLESERLRLNLDSVDQHYIRSFWIAFIDWLSKTEKAAIIAWVNQLVETEKSLEVVSPEAFNQSLNSVTFDQAGDIDGISVLDFKEVLLQTANKQEIVAMAKKYGVIIPKSQNKEAILKLFFFQLETLEKLTETVKEKAQNSTVLELKALAANLGVKIHTYLTKEDMIDYIITNVLTVTQKPMQSNENVKRRRLEKKPVSQSKIHF